MMKAKKAHHGKRAGKGKRLVRRKQAAAAHDPPLSARELARVRESTQNVKEGKYRDFTSVDQMWEYVT